jgi:hypothetical protein
VLGTGSGASILSAAVHVAMFGHSALVVVSTFQPSIAMADFKGIEPRAESGDRPTAEGHPAVDPVALAQLWAGQFQHFTSIGVAGAGGVLVLLQAELIPTEQRWWLAIALFAASAVLSMYGQIAVVDEASAGLPPGRKPRALRGLALACLGAAGGAALATLFR